MASDSQPKPVPPGGTADPNQKHVSGMLVMSIVLSLSAFLILPIIGQISGLILGWIGRRRVRTNPQLIGPRLATWSIGIALVALVAQGVMLYRSSPGLLYVRAVSTKATGFLEHLRKGEYEDAYGEMSPAWQKAHTVEELKKRVEAVFPEGEKIEAPKEQVEFQKDFAAKDFEKQIVDWLDEDYPSETSYVLPFVLHGDKGGRVGFDLTLDSRRTGYWEFEVDLTDFRLKPLPKEDGDAAKDGAAEEKPADGEAAGADGAAEDGNGAATEEGAGKGSDEKPTEDGKQEEPR